MCNIYVCNILSGFNIPTFPNVIIYKLTNMYPLKLCMCMELTNCLSFCCYEIFTKSLPPPQNLCSPVQTVVCIYLSYRKQKLNQLNNNNF